MAKDQISTTQLLASLRQLAPYRQLLTSIKGNLYLAPEQPMYQVNLSREELILHVGGLDSQVRIVCQSIIQAQSAGLALKNNLALLVNIDKQFDKLQQILTDAESAGSSSTANSGSNFNRDCIDNAKL